MKIGIVTDVMLRGGVTTYLVALARVARAHGHTVEVVVEASSGSGIAETLAEEGIPVHGIRLYHRRHAGDVIASDSARILESGAFDAVHVACGIPWSCLTFRGVAAEAGIPLSLTEGYVPDDLELDDAVRELIAASYSAARAVVFVSEGNRRVMERLVGLDGVRHTVIPNGVAVREIARRAPSGEQRLERFGASRAAGGATAVALARFAPQKGLDTLADALEVVRPGVLRQVDLFGEGPERDELVARAASLRDVRLAVRPWATDVVAELAEHDLFVLPSRGEGLPVALLEAMAAGIPIVATATPGSAEALAGGDAGVLVPIGDSRALADALERVVDTPTEAIERAALARQRVEEHYDVEAVMARTVGLWED
jgi:glycosyltransferase involved in cell wall biosynthesis